MSTCCLDGYLVQVLHCDEVSISSSVRHNGHQTYRVTTLTSQGHVTSSVTWPFYSRVANSYRCFIVTKSLFPAIFETMGLKHIWVTTLTSQGHVTSSVTWPIDSEVGISYRWSIVANSLGLYPAIFEIMDTKHIGVYDLDLWGSRDVIGHLTIGLGIGFDPLCP